MKKYISSIVLFSLLFSSTAFAEGSWAPTVGRVPQTTIASTTLRIEQEKEMMQAKIASTTARIASTTEFIQQKKEELQSDIEKRIGKKLDAERSAIAQRYEDVLKSLNNLVERVQSRITKMQAAGTDTTTIQASLDAAKTQIALAESDLTALENALATPLGTSTRKTTLTNIEAQNTKAKKDTQVAYTSLMKVINSLTPEPKATSTRPIMHPEIKVQSTTTIQ